jgi:hypothetical protein
MEPKIAANRGNFSSFVRRQTRKFYARVIPYGSYNENLVACALMTIGLGVLVGTTLWTLIAFRIF